MKLIIVVSLCIFGCIQSCAPVKADATLEAWSCSPDTKGISKSYRRKVLDVLNAIEIDIMTYASWDLLYRTTGAGDEEVTGSAGCIPSADVKNMEDCYACIIEARQHLLHLCPNNWRGSVFLNSCTLMFAREEPATPDWEELTIDDEPISVQRADS